MKPRSGHPIGPLGWIVLVVGLVLLVWLVFRPWADPEEPERAKGVVAACDDTSRLIAAGLLDEAGAATRAVREEGLTCSRDTRDEGGAARETIDLSGDVDEDGDVDAKDVSERAALAARSREQGDQYLQAAKLTREAEKRAEARDADRAAERFEEARVTALRRSLKGYALAFQRDPHDEATRKGLQDVVALLAVPADGAANERCRAARQLRQVHALQAASTLYAQALRTGRTTQCLDFALNRARSDRSRARRAWRDGEALEGSGSDPRGPRALHDRADPRPVAVGCQEGPGRERCARSA